MAKSRIDPFSFLFDLLIDFALIGLGIVLYYHFNVQALAPVILSPIVTNLFGNKNLAVLVISGVPFFVGLFGLLKTLFRTAKKLTASSKPR